MIVPRRSARRAHQRPVLLATGEQLVVEIVRDVQELAVLRTHPVPGLGVVDRLRESTREQQRDDREGVPEALAIRCECLLHVEPSGTRFTSDSIRVGGRCQAHEPACSRWTGRHPTGQPAPRHPLRTATKGRS